MKFNKILLIFVFISSLFAKDIIIKATGINESDAKQNALRELASQIEVSLETSLSSTKVLTNDTYSKNIISQSKQESKVKFLGLQWGEFDYENKTIKLVLPNSSHYLYKNRLDEILNKISFLQKTIYVLEIEQTKLEYYQKIKFLIKEFLLLEKVANYLQISSLPKPKISLDMLDAHISVKIDKLMSKNLKQDVFLDNNTGLIWQKKIPFKKLNWDDAKEYCQNLFFEEHSSFRLPFIEELESIKEYMQKANSDKLNIYWSNTSNSQRSIYVKSYNFSNNIIKNYNKKNRLNVICVKE
jgi:hypothetical protein